MSWPEFWLLFDGWEYRQELEWNKVRIIGATMVNTSFHAPKMPMMPQKFMPLPRLDPVVNFTDSALQKMLEKFSKQDGKTYILLPNTDE